MSSDRWKHLSDDERFLRIVPVCDRFSEAYGGLARINYTTPTPYCIYVSTSLSRGCLIQEVPREYEGVPVEQDPIREAMDEYLATFSKVLSHLAGWSEAEIEAVAHDRHTAFTNPWGTNAAALNYVSKYLASEKLSAIPDNTTARAIHQRIESEINAGMSSSRFYDFPGKDPKYDWLAAAHRVEQANSELERRYLLER